MTTDGPDSSVLFEITDVEPGATRTLDPRDPSSGSYELEIRVPLGSPVVRWTAAACAEKLVVVRFTETGIEIADRCPGE